MVTVVDASGRGAGGCAPSGTSVPLPREQAEALARLLNAVADPVRLQLLSLVAAAGDGTCLAELAGPVGLSERAVARHLGILVEAELLRHEQRTSSAHYRLVDGAAEHLADFLAETLEPR